MTPINGNLRGKILIDIKLFRLVYELYGLTEEKNKIVDNLWS
jgi:hypothetical protein